MYKKIVCATLLAVGLGAQAFADDLVTNSVASNSGIYLGGQLGFSHLHYDGSSYTSSILKSSYDNKYHFAGRGYVGYAFSQFISAELGYDYYGYPKFKNEDGNTQSFLQHGLDLVAKANLPLDYGFSLYAKAGFAFIHRGVLNSNAGTFVQKDANNKITPVGALGVSYWFASNIALDFSWTKTMSVSDLPTTDFVGLGFIYKINL